MILLVHLLIEVKILLPKNYAKTTRKPKPLLILSQKLTKLQKKNVPRKKKSNVEQEKISENKKIKKYLQSERPLGFCGGRRSSLRGRFGCGTLCF